MSYEQPYLTAALVLLHSLRAQRNSSLSRLCTGRRGLSLHPSLDLRGHSEERLLDIRGCLGRGFQELNAERVREFLALFRADHSLGRQVALVAHQQLVHVLCRISVNFVQPLLYVVEGFRVRHVIHHDNAVRTAIVRGGNSSEAFLSGSVPNLEFNGLSIELNSADFL